MAKESIFRQIISLGVTGDLTVTDVKHVRVTNFGAIMGAIMLSLWVPIALASNETLTAVENSLAVFTFLFVLTLNSRFRHQVAASLLLATCHFQLIWALAFFGISSGSLLYYPILLIAPYVAFRRQSRRVAHGFAVYAGLAMLFFIVFRERFPTNVFLMDVRQQEIMNSAIALTGLLLVVAVFMNMVDETEDALNRETARANALLLNVLPSFIAERLKAAPDKTIADRHQQVTVLFADIVGFTPLSARLSAVKTVEVLNEIFTTFDEICERAGVEKIRTIGDGYMVASGAPISREDHAEAMVRVAIEIRDYMNSRPTDVPLSVRIGLNSGEVVAGIVGISRFHYDVWGDVVNVAARMEALGEPGRIQIARATWERIHDKFPCESRGRIVVKGKGEMETWFVS
ncbi:MAG: adenylate/guanylate cyclase domain-containing protein [Halieaceae bacterium]|nr:adenylate/guanylate cyclase domain-containing protein [Halieaceae bacterium]